MTPIVITNDHHDGDDGGKDIHNLRTLRNLRTHRIPCHSLNRYILILRSPVRYHIPHVSHNQDRQEIRDEHPDLLWGCEKKYKNKICMRH